MARDEKHYICTTTKPRHEEELFQSIQSFRANVALEQCCKYIDYFKKVIPEAVEVNTELQVVEVNSFFLTILCLFFLAPIKDHVYSRKQELAHMDRSFVNSFDVYCVNIAVLLSHESHYKC